LAQELLNRTCCKAFLTLAVIHHDAPQATGNKMNRHHFLRLSLSMAVTTCVAGAAWAQAYPTKPVRLVVPFAPGGTTDIIARLVANQIQPALGQMMIVDNRAGAGGLIGASEVVKAAPDGYTLGVATVSTTASVPAINAKAPYNPLTDFTSIINIAATPNVLAVHPSFPAKEYKAFLEAIKANPSKYSFASSGTGGVGHMQMELFKSLTGTQITHIPYKGAGPALNDAVSGQVPMIFDNLPSILPFVKDGRLTAIAVAAPQRLPSLPNVPTFKELGLEPVNRMAYYGIHAPKNLPPEMVTKISNSVKKTLELPEVRKRIEEAGAIIVANTPEQFTAETKAEFEIYKKVVQQQKLQLE
jgi:tripartite-type tricarboxylate transporter receptor subunit TctC